MSPDEQVATKSPGSLLADEMYGTPPTPVETQIVEDPPAGDTPAVDDAHLGADLPTSDEPAGEDLSIGEQPSTGADEVEVHTIEQLVDHLEVEPGWIENLTIQQKVNGKMIDVPIAEALSTHRQVAAADDYLSNAKTKSKAIMAEASTQAEQLNLAVVEAGTILKALNDELQTDITSTDFQSLRTSDPAEYAAKKDEFRERHARIERLQAAARQQYQTVSEQFNQQFEDAQQAKLPEEHQMLVDRVPEWSDDSKATTERAELVNYLYEDGFNEEEVKIASFNGRMLAVAIKAMRYDKSKEKSDATSKKVVKIPKVLKPGAPAADTSHGSADKDDPVSILYGKS